MVAVFVTPPTAAETMAHPFNVACEVNWKDALAEPAATSAERGTTSATFVDRRTMLVEVLAGAVMVMLQFPDRPGTTDCGEQVSCEIAEV